MDLIEQLGGYEKAKEIVFDPLHPQMTHVSNDGCHWVNEEFAHIPEINEQMQGMIKISDIRHSLLEHRRQHNIFEVGDKVVSRCADKEIRIFTYQETIGRNILVKCKKGKGYCYPKKWFSHANDAEIKAGKRLEVNQ